MAQSVFFFGDDDIINITPGTAASWVDIDVSAYVPAGATGVLLKTANNNAVGNNRTCNFRKNGSTDAYTDDSGKQYWNSTAYEMVGVDANRVLEAYLENITDIQVYLLGYTISGVTFFDNYQHIQMTGNDKNVLIDCSSFIPEGADGAIVRFDGAYFALLYPVGQTLAARQYLHHGTTLVKLNADRDFWFYRLDLNAIHLYILGYVTDGITFLLDPESLGNAGYQEYIELTALPAGSNGGWFTGGAYGNGSITYLGYIDNIRPDGSTEDVRKLARGVLYSACGSNLLVEAYGSYQYYRSVYLVAYSEGVPSVPTNIEIPLCQIADITPCTPLLYTGESVWHHVPFFHVKQLIDEDDLNAYVKANTEYLKDFERNTFLRQDEFIPWVSGDGFLVQNTVNFNALHLEAQGNGIDGYAWPDLHGTDQPGTILSSGAVYRVERDRPITFDVPLLYVSEMQSWYPYNRQRCASLRIYLADSSTLTTQKRLGFVIFERYIKGLGYGGSGEKGDTWYGDSQPLYKLFTQGWTENWVGNFFIRMRVTFNCGNWIKYYINGKLLYTLPYDDSKAQIPQEGDLLKLFIRADAGIWQTLFYGLTVWKYAPSVYKLGRMIISREY